MNEVKSIRVDFALRLCSYLPTTIGNELVPLVNSARYLGIHLDSKMTWQTHIKTNREHIKGLQRKYYWLLGYHSKLSLTSLVVWYSDLGFSKEIQSKHHTESTE